MGRWLLMNNLLSVVNLQAVSWVVAAFHGREQRRAVFLAGLATCSVTLLVSMPLTIKLGVLGALVGACISVAARAILGGYFVHRLRHLNDPQEVAAAIGELS